MSLTKEDIQELTQYLTENGTCTYQLTEEEEIALTKHLKGEL